MPELPEVEVVRRGLERWAVGRTVATAEVLHPRATRRNAAGAEDFAASVAGHTLLSAERRGKFLWLPLGEGGQATGEAVTGHLGMSGQLLVKPSGTPDEKHLRIRFTFTDDGPELRFVDQRTFGGMALEKLETDRHGVVVPASVAHIARDALDPEFDVDFFHSELRRRDTGLKRALLDQTRVSGIGNIYADEALWIARLHYDRPTSKMRRPDTDRVLAAAREVMGAALAVGGTSFDSLYVDVNGESGYFARSLHAYGREGEPCERCGTAIKRESFMNRSSFYCPKCQRLSR
ncbi:bifunctional DNA-formamidopyrimidine glycosylase/DNA-(apurinic or apyrimidinic site) lyase [Catenulispora pinisilvae]|uniref:bifunctional DNA-formamidopyrimidine glycosylase/DNA-(apurinic or apyrimidinic site) lyase n=1 Tax=Catenulispora pinisilvae TaxID=2705253 RepID=UPI0018917F0C|nr:bifunctional DNA-formamidopyrimidine glycosylase/DNA-(apurinic or apyrimidinic site) lyase [Catenulispora pinisilvae]